MPSIRDALKLTEGGLDTKKERVLAPFIAILRYTLFFDHSWNNIDYICNLINKSSRVEINTNTTHSNDYKVDAVWSDSNIQK